MYVLISLIAVNIVLILISIFYFRSLSEKKSPTEEIILQALPLQMLEPTPALSYKPPTKDIIIPPSPLQFTNPTLSILYKSSTKETILPPSLVQSPASTPVLSSKPPLSSWYGPTANLYGDECPDLGSYFLPIDDCKAKCLNTPGCTAISVSANLDNRCSLSGCKGDEISNPKLVINPSLGFQGWYYL
jgi:hypothetical protein